MLALALLLAMQQPSPPPHTPVETPPTLRARFTADMRSKNLDDVLGIYAAGAEFIDPSGHDITTPEALRALYVDVFSRYDSDITLGPPHHHEIGGPYNPEAIVETGIYSENLRTHATGQTTRVCGTYTFTYTHSKTPGEGWRVSKMEWGTNPCPATP